MHVMVEWYLRSEMTFLLKYCDFFIFKLFRASKLEKITRALGRPRTFNLLNASQTPAADRWRRLLMVFKSRRSQWAMTWWTKLLDIGQYPVSWRHLLKWRWVQFLPTVQAFFRVSKTYHRSSRMKQQHFDRIWLLTLTIKTPSSNLDFRNTKRHSLSG